MFRGLWIFTLIIFPSLAAASEITTYEYKLGNGITISLNQDQACEYDRLLFAGIAIIPKEKELNQICWTWIESNGERYALLFTPQREYGETVPEQKLNKRIVEVDE